MTEIETTRTTAGARRPAMDRDVAMHHAALEYARLLELLRELGADEWNRPTECPPWDVRAMAGHCVGMARFASSLPQMARQDLKARRGGGTYLDTLTALQVEEQAALTIPQLLERLAEVAPRAARGRRRLTKLIGRVTIPDAQDVGDAKERWKAGFLLETILTRDPWMHRMDICRATGRTPHLTADHDGLLVADVVAEWAGRHSRPYTLVLEGPAGGKFTSGTDGSELRMEAVDFCRVLSGRAADTPVQHELLDVSVPF